ncbi:hypothetical protein [Microbacterium sp. WCS2018Hpa-23]|uniref:hypothetical protein n=1 Tax=Microbacterium sp. WCS2018Hpa-23 TaxID=3073634 RepID=UPI002882F25A|nr:hypothetical protein [Microbacterium sp. WCS2018Hpa-23]
MKTMTKTTMAIMSGTLLVGLIAGCAPEPTTAPTSNPSPSATATLTPSPSPSAVPTADPADPTTWVISESGVGPISIGGDLTGTLAGLPDTWTNDTENCAWTAWWNAPDSSYGVYFVRGTESDTAPIGEISVYTAAESPTAVPSPLTAEGIGLGATKAEVLAAYPDAQEGTAQIGGGTWLMLPGDDAAHVFFEFREGADVASDIVVTTRDEPSYEVCG